MILCTKNDTVFTIYDMLLDKIPNEERVFKSIDTPILDPEGAAAVLDVHAEDYNVESINTLTPTGLPPHNLRLKCRRLEEDDRFDQVVYLPRIKFEYGTGENDRTVKFRRIQDRRCNDSASTSMDKKPSPTALSRVRTMSSIRVLKLGLPMPSYLLNVVYYELLLPK
ncbi:hypothetical protein QR680_009528 [Steinernema hermaphroditum]|uniref:Uncharacterized protein n=1 Tax=Steinernema hermaphroditum TaxID=289476 RepID=A0AA39ILX2_9BILA|nr:hypothetical protein QR680_009528 [Steinernema hermaphroditum]